MKWVMGMRKDEKSKEFIAKTLVELLHQKPLDLISIKELCFHAKVGRTAFYNHFKSKEDVLKYIYRKAHRQHFEDKFKDFNYLCSDRFIQDMIHFFDKNSDLLLVLFKWNLIGFIAKYNTEMSLNYVKEYDDQIIKQNSAYFISYTCSSIFNTCVMWLINQKDISADELFETILHFRHFIQYE